MAVHRSEILEEILNSEQQNTDVKLKEANSTEKSLENLIKSSLMA
jgi:sRNA-binding carbon storage regulator CsrA